MKFYNPFKWHIIENQGKFFGRIWVWNSYCRKFLKLYLNYNGPYYKGASISYDRSCGFDTKESCEIEVRSQKNIDKMEKTQKKDSKKERVV